MAYTSTFCIHLKPRAECDNPACNSQSPQRTPTTQMLSDLKLTIITLTHEAVRCHVIPRAEAGQTFVVDKFTKGLVGDVAHVRDFRYVNKDAKKDYQIWSLAADMYTIAYEVVI